MKRRYRWILALALLGLSAYCATAPRPRLTCHLPAADPTWRWIGLKRDRTRPCPEAPLWRVAPLFDLARLPVDAQSRAKKLGLDNFCLYEARSAGECLPSETVRSLARAEPDAMALVLSAGNDLQSLTSPAFERDFLQQAGQTPLPDPAGKPRARLVLLDTQPTGEGIPLPPAPPARWYRSQHGYSLANIAGRLTSSGDRFQRPAADVATRLAMPYPSYDPNTPGSPDFQHGGYVGTIGGLTEAIGQEIAAWEAECSRDWKPGDKGCRPTQHLVLNLSLGWDGKKFGGSDEKTVCEMHPAVQSVYKALEFAAGEGALVVAAAGNRGGGPDATTGPLLPAGWESRPAEPAVPQLAGKPFVYAVGGVQAQSYPLANSRLRGLPRLTAYADHAVVKDSALQPTAPLTGTSVATVVVSSAAAVVWHLHPEMTAKQVMTLLYDSGVTLKQSNGTAKPADFYYSSPFPITAPAPEVRRISLCAALSKACAGGVCSPPACEAFSQQIDLAPQLITFKANTTIDAATLYQQLSFLPPSCKVPTIYYSGGTPNFPCPFEQLPSLMEDPEVSPQPGADPCPSCTLTRSANPLALSTAASHTESPELYTLRIEIPQCCWSTPLQATNLEINHLNSLDENAPSISYAIDLNLIPGQLLEIRNLDLHGGQTATLNFVSQPAVGSPMSIESSVFIDDSKVEARSLDTAAARRPAPSRSSAENRKRSASQPAARHSLGRRPLAGALSESSARRRSVRS